MDVNMDEYIEDYKKKRDFVCDGLKERYKITKPDGAFYVFPQVPWGTDEEFVTEAIKHDLLIIPGSVFSEKKTHFRLSYAATFGNPGTRGGYSKLPGLALTAILPKIIQMCSGLKHGIVHLVLRS